MTLCRALKAYMKVNLKVVLSLLTKFEKINSMMLRSVRGSSMLGCRLLYRNLYRYKSKQEG